MRRSWIAVLVIAGLTAVACAHPIEDPLPGAEPAPTSGRPSTTSTSSGDDETRDVCREAIDESRDAVAEIKEKIAAVQANPTGGTVTLLAVRSTATRWRDDLEEFAKRPVRSEVRDALNEGVDVLNTLLSTDPRELADKADQAQRDIDNFMDDLSSACE